MSRLPKCPGRYPARLIVPWMIICLLWTSAPFFGQSENRSAPGASDLGASSRANQLYQAALEQLKLGDLPAAYTRFRRVLSASAAASDRRLYIYSLINIAGIQKQLGYTKKASDSYERALSLIDVGLGDASAAARREYVSAKVDVLNKLAEMQSDIGNTEVALDLLDQSLKLLRADPADEPAVALIASITQPNSLRVMEVSTLTGLGDVHTARGDGVEGDASYAAALALAEQVGYDAGAIDILLRMATHAARKGRSQDALTYASRADVLVAKRGRLDQRMNLEAVRAKIERSLKRYGAADLKFQEAIRISETLRADFIVPDQRASYFASMFAPFDDYIDFLMERHEGEPDAGFDKKAFNVSERRRARALLDSLKVVRADIRQGVDPVLLAREDQIRKQLNASAREQMIMGSSQWSPALDEDALNEPAALQKADYAFLIAELARIETAIRQQSPRYAELTQPRPLRLAAIQTLLNDETVLLNYTLGERRSYLWQLERNSFKSYLLPPRAEIEELVRTAYADLAGGISVGDANTGFTSASQALSRILLGPVAASIGGKKIVVVADGALQYLSFSSLPDPRSESSGGEPMVASNEIQFAPSASVVSVLRQEAEQRPRPPRSIAIFADPVFSKDDERFVTAGSLAEPSVVSTDDPEEFEISALRFISRPSRNGGDEVPRLPFSRREAEAISAAAPADTSFKAVDFNASREKIGSVDLSKYGIVHFATHGILDSEYPELSSVVLSLFNEKAQPVNGFLRLNEIYTMRLNADLVVLSACQTALGKEVRGEGLIGLTRGFMYAGAPRVVASLWKVDDAATAEFMKIFYQKMFKGNMRPGAALRAAKIELMKQKRWAGPYYWAAFELQGEWQ